MRVILSAATVASVALLAACGTDVETPLPGQNAIGTIHEQTMQGSQTATQAAQRAQAAAERAAAAAERAEQAVMRMEQGYQQSLRK